MVRAVKRSKCATKRSSAAGALHVNLDKTVEPSGGETFIAWALSYPLKGYEPFDRER
jgi:hypothetical protein